MNVLEFRQKNFPTYPKYTLRCIFPAELIGTLSFAVRAGFSGKKWNFSVLNAKTMKKFVKLKLIAAPIKKYFLKNLRAQFFFYILKYKVSKKIGFTKNRHFWTSYLAYFFKKLTYLHTNLLWYSIFEFPCKYWIRVAYH